MRRNKHKIVSKFIVVATIATIFTACTTTKHTLARTTDRVKVYKKSEVISSYDLKAYESDIRFDSDTLVGFSFTEEPKKRQDNYRQVPIAPGERPLNFSDIDVNIDLCKHWKQTSYRETPLEERAYTKNYSFSNPTEYTLFMSLKKLKKKNLISTKASEQEDICIYIDSKFYGHFGRFRDKSNKIRYKASEVNAVRLALEKK